MLQLTTLLLIEALLARQLVSSLMFVAKQQNQRVYIPRVLPSSPGVFVVTTAGIDVSIAYSVCKPQSSEVLQHPSAIHDSSCICKVSKVNSCSEPLQN